MKKVITWSLAALMCFALAGCAEETSIVGVWESDAIEVLGSDQPSSEGNYIQFYFNEDATGKEVIAASDTINETAFTYTADDNTLTITFDENTEYVLPYQLKDDALTLTQNNAEITYHRSAEG